MITVPLREHLVDAGNLLLHFLEAALGLESGFDSNLLLRFLEVLFVDPLKDVLRNLGGILESLAVESPSCLLESSLMPDM